MTPTNTACFVASYVSRTGHRDTVLQAYARGVGDGEDGSHFLGISATVHTLVQLGLYGELVRAFGPDWVLTEDLVCDVLDILDPLPEDMH